MESYLSKIKRVIGQDLKGEVKTFENLTSHFSMQTKASNEDNSNCDNFSIVNYLMIIKFSLNIIMGAYYFR